MHILIAPNAFKNSLTATEVAEAIKTGLVRSRLDCTCDCLPIADGGDGTAALIVERCRGKWIEVEVAGPRGAGIASRFGLIDHGKTAVIEMADASGLRLIGKDDRNPMLTTSFGTGQLMAKALEHNISNMIIGVGGSATVDGGAGILAALGVRFLDASGTTLAPYPNHLAALHEVDIAMMDPRITQCTIRVLCDVRNKLLGREGAAAIFGPQKGATPGQVRELDNFLSSFAAITARKTGRDMAAVISGGAAGGAAAGLFAYFDAKLTDGIEHYLALTGFANALKTADIVITGEGSLDEQTLQGKGPAGAAAAAKRLSIPVIGLAGRIPVSDVGALRQFFDVLLPIGNQPSTLEEALENTRFNLERTATELGNTLHLRASKNQ